MTDFPVKVDIPVAWGDMDAFGHVNNTVYLRWFESARIEFFTAVGMAHHGGGKGPILARTSCDFRIPLQYPDTVRAEAAVSAIGTKSFTLVYRIHSRTHDAIAAEGDSVVVWFDYGAQKAIPIDADLRARIERFLAT
jgi:acyl-CoA thioester hydrolase